MPFEVKEDNNDSRHALRVLPAWVWGVRVGWLDEQRWLTLVIQLLLSKPAGTKDSTVTLAWRRFYRQRWFGQGVGKGQWQAVTPVIDHGYGWLWETGQHGSTASSNRLARGNYPFRSVNEVVVQQAIGLGVGVLQSLGNDGMAIVFLDVQAENLEVKGY